MKKPTPSRAGNGRDCITHPEHGQSIVLPSGREWCPAQSHDGKRGDPGIDPTTPFLDKQLVAEEAVTA